jgi:hypothetical protein
VSKSLVELCDHLTVVVRELAEQRLDAREIVAEFRKLHLKYIEASSIELQDRTLIQLVNQVSRRRPAPALVPGEPDLFGYNVPPVVVIRQKVGGKVRKAHALTMKMTKAEALAWIEDHSRARDEYTEDVAEMSRLLDEADRFFETPASTLEDALTAKSAKEGAKKSADA